MKMIEQVGYHFHTQVEKWDQDQTLWVARRLGIAKPEAAHFEGLHVRPYEVLEIEGNQLLDTTPAVGVQDLWKNVLGTYTQAVDQTHSGVCVGDSSSAENANQTDLQAATNKWYEDNDSSFPALNGLNGVDWKSSFGASDGNFAWNEWGVIIPGASAPSAITPAATKPTNYTLLNRKVQSLGTKSSGTWTLTGTITLT
jgi:hypothetical protein